MDSEHDQINSDSSRKYFLVYNASLRDFEKIYFRDQSRNKS